MTRKNQTDYDNNPNDWRMKLGARNVVCVKKTSGYFQPILTRSPFSQIFNLTRLR